MQKKRATGQVLPFSKDFNRVLVHDNTHGGRERAPRYHVESDEMDSEREVWEWEAAHDVTALLLMLTG